MIKDRIPLHSVLLPLLIIIIITQHFITNLHTRAEGKKSDYKSNEGNCKKNTKMTRLSLQNKLSLSLSIRKNDIGNKKRKKERKETPQGLTEAAFVVKEKHVKLYKRDFQGYMEGRRQKRVLTLFGCRLGKSIL